MKLSELIAEIGDANVEAQFLSECLTGKQKSLKGGGTQVSFVTASASVMDLIDPKSPKIGVVIWLPRDKFEEIRERETICPTT
jgi:hypothetical protein